MKKTAGILKFISTIALILEIVGAVLLALIMVFLLVAGSFSDLAAKENSAITIEGGTMTPAELDALKPIILIALATALVSVIFTMIGTIKTRTALGECKEERPFSKRCVDALKASARIEVIGGLFGIVTAIVLSLMASALTVNGTPVGKTSTTASLTFLFYAVQKYLLFHVAQYGHSLETDPDKK